MAVDNLDIGALIAKSIDTFYEEVSQERLRFEQNYRAAQEYIQNVILPLYRGAPVTTVTEADALDENPGADDFIKQAEAQKKKKAAAKPAAAPIQDKSVYRKGYQAGWKAAHEGRPAAPDKEDADYVRGYMAGHKISGHANAIMKHYDAAIEAHNAGDREGAAAHVANTKDDIDALTKHFVPQWERPYANVHPDDLPDHVGFRREGFTQMTLPVQGLEKQGEKVIAGQRPALVDAIHQLTPHINRASIVGGDDHRDHPIQFGNQLRALATGYGKRMAQGEQGKAALGQGGEESSDDKADKKGPMERAVRDEAPQMSPEEVEAAKLELVRNAWHPQEVKDHIAQHGRHPLAHHDSLEDARDAAMSHWKDRLLRHINSARAPGMKFEAPTLVDTVDHNGQPMQVNFDVAKALTDVVTHPAGAFSRKARADAIKNQLGASTDRPWGYTGQRSHPLHKVAAVMQRAEKWLHGQHEQFGRGGFMHNLSAQRATQYGAGRHAGVRGGQSPEEAVEEALDVFEHWLIENVDVDDDQFASIMAAMEERAYARLRPVTEA